MCIESTDGCILILTNVSGSRKRDRPASESGIYCLDQIICKVTLNVLTHKYNAADAFPSAKRSMREAHKSRSFDNATIIEENGHTSNTISECSLNYCKINNKNINDTYS